MTMKLPIRFLLILCASVVLMLAFSPNRVLACGGGEIDAATIEEAVTFSVLVKGTVIEVDDARHNAILYVENYLVGSGASQLLVYRNNPVLSVVHRERNYDTGCLYGGFVNEWFVGMEGYFALDRLTNGSYYASGGYDGEYYYSVSDGEVRYSRDDPESEEAYMEITESLPEAEFIALVAELSGEKASYPHHADYDLRRSTVYITTEAGTRYVLPVDRTEGVETIPGAACSDDCWTYSPDGSHFAHYLPDKHIEFSYPNASYDREYGYNIPVEMDGEAVLFAPNSNFVAVWHEDSLSLYQIMTVSPTGSENGMGYGLGMGVSPLVTLPLQVDEGTSATEWHLKAAWSADSTTLAYEDSAGLWHFDFFEQAEPRLIAPTESLIEAVSVLELSTTGRYVRYGTPAGWILLDTVTNETFDSALVSPDEASLVFIMREVASEAPQGCNLPLRTRCAETVQRIGITLKDYLWTNNNTVLIGYCAEICRSVVVEMTGSKGMRISPYGLESHDSQKLFIDLAVQPETGLGVIAVGGDELEFTGTDDRFEVTGLDSPIASVEWGALLWYSAR